MPKNIVICSDGTGNTANKNRGTNVFKIFEAVDLRIENFSSPQDKSVAIDRQVTLYDDGVGSQSFILFKILGGAFGWGLKRNVKQLYLELARVYEPGDNIYLFGFSRGAFTIRTLVGFIANCGIPKKSAFTDQNSLLRRVDDAYKHHQLNYRSLLSRFCFPDWLNRWLPKGFNNILPRPVALRIPFGDGYDPGDYHPEPPIKFVGVWDTVSAVGLPFKCATEFWNKFIYRFSFRNNNLYEKVEKACHAVSIDDERQTFHPMLWNEDPTPYKTKTEEDWKNEWIEQVWFPGVHSNVGGGYPKQGMSLVPLHWMMVRAHRAGLMFIDEDWDLIRDHGNITDKLYKSRSGLAAYYRYLPRNIFAMCREFKAVCKVHESMRYRVSLGTEGYAPGNLPPEFLLVKDRPGAHDNYTYSHSVFKGASPKKESPLWESIQPLVNLRRNAYYLFLATTLLGVAFYIWDLLRTARPLLVAQGVPEPDCWQTLWQAWERFEVTSLVFSFANDYLWAGLLVAFVTSFFTRLALQGKRTAFWHAHR